MSHDAYEHQLDQLRAEIVKLQRGWDQSYKTGERLEVERNDAREDCAKLRTALEEIRQLSRHAGKYCGKCHGRVATPSYELRMADVADAALGTSALQPEVPGESK